MKIKRILPIAFCLLFISVLSSAASPKTITLTDGSVIKGDVIKFENGIYTINSTQLGEIKVEEEKIVSILSQSQTGAQKTVPSAGSQSTQDSQGSLGSQTSQSASLKDQAQQIQGQVMGNQALMEKIQSLLDDPEIKQLIADPNLMHDVMTYDENTIRGNANVQKLLDNPRIQKLIKDIEQETQQ